MMRNKRIFMPRTTSCHFGSAVPADMIVAKQAEIHACTHCLLPKERPRDYACCRLSSQNCH